MIPSVPHAVRRPLGLALLLATSARSQSECDLLTAHPHDPGRTAPPVDFSVLDADRAIAACQAALATDPGNGRWMTQLGRAFNKKGDHAASLAWTRKGVEAGHAFAFHALALHYHYGEGVPKDLDQQVSWLHRGRKAGLSISSQRLAELGLEDLTHPYLDANQAAELLVEAGDAPRVSGLWGDLHYALALRAIYGKEPAAAPRYRAGQVPTDYEVRLETRGARRLEYLTQAAGAVRHYEAFLGLTPGQQVVVVDPDRQRKQRLVDFRSNLLTLDRR